MQCELGRPRCRERAVIAILTQGSDLNRSNHGLLAKCCATCANRFLYGPDVQSQADYFLQGYGLTNARVLLLTDELENALKAKSDHSKAIEEHALKEEEGSKDEQPF